LALEKKKEKKISKKLNKSKEIKNKVMEVIK